MHITLTGNLGSGKSTLGKLMAAEYGYEIFSTGKVIREIADSFGISVLEMNKKMEADHQYDKMIDDTTARISREKKGQKLLFDSRLAWHFVEESFKVFLSVSLPVAAARVMADSTRGSVETYSSEQECMERLSERAKTEDRRYRDLYRIDYFNAENYNLVLDSSECPTDVLGKILVEEEAAYEKALSEGKKPGTKLILCKNRPAEDFAAEKAKGTCMEKNLFGVDFVVVEL